MLTDATVALGFGADHVRVLGAILLIATLLYALPTTSVLGAILITAFLGGAVAVHLQHRDPRVTLFLPARGSAGYWPMIGNFV